MSTDTLTRHRGHAYSYDVTMLGYNYRMDELRAAVGLAQLPRLLSWNQKRKALSDLYRSDLAARIPEVRVPFGRANETAAHLMPVLLPPGVDRLKIMGRLHENGIQTSIHYPPTHHFSYYRQYFPGIHLPKTEEFCARELTLPLHPGMTEQEVVLIVDFFQRALRGK
jgi:dTDP-4-amino-4,6-dideoxygalactose transaminase